MKYLINLLAGTFILVLIIVISCTTEKKETVETSDLNRKEQLGKLLFFEKTLSTPVGQDCSDCHKPEFAFADPDTGLPVSKGSG